MKSDDIVVIRNYINEYDAKMAKVTLEPSNIDAIIRRDDCAGYRPRLSFGTGLQIIVRRENAEEADAVLLETEGQEPRDEGP